MRDLILIDTGSLSLDLNNFGDTTIVQLVTAIFLRKREMTQEKVLAVTHSRLKCSSGGLVLMVHVPRDQ